MKEYRLLIEVDEEELRLSCSDIGEDVSSMSTEDLIMREFGWLDTSSIWLLEIEEVK